MIEIQLKNGYLLTADKKNWIFGKKVFQKNLDREVVRGEYFFQSTESMVETIFEEYLREEDASTLKELVEKVESSKIELLEKLKKYEKQE